MQCILKCLASFCIHTSNQNVRHLPSFIFIQLIKMWEIQLWKSSFFMTHFGCTVESNGHTFKNRNSLPLHQILQHHLTCHQIFIFPEETIWQISPQKMSKQACCYLILIQSHDRQYESSPQTSFCLIWDLLPAAIRINTSKM